MESVCPERARAILQVAEAAQDRAKLQQPKWQVHALLALAAAARVTGQDLRPLDDELGRAFEKLRPVQSPCHAELLDSITKPDWASVEARLRAWRASYATAARYLPLVLVELLVAQGEFARARAHAERVPHAGARRQARRLADRGLVGYRSKLRFAGTGGAAAMLDVFDPSLALIQACASHPDSENRRSLELLRQAAQDLSPKDRQLAMVELSPLAYAVGGERLAASFADAPRYPSLRRRAWERVRAAAQAAERKPERSRAPFGAKDHALAQCIVARALDGARAVLASPGPPCDLERGLRGLPFHPAGDRAAFDEGRALGPDRARHTQALVRASGRDLAAALASASEGSPLTQTRRRTLRWLGGERASRRLRELLLRGNGDPDLRSDLLADLASVDPDAAAQCLRVRAESWLLAPDRGARAACFLERSGACRPGFARAWLGLAELVLSRNPTHGAAWIADLLDPARPPAESLPTLDSLVPIVSGLVSGAIHPSGLEQPAAELIPTLREARDRLLERPLRDIMAAVCTNDETYSSMSMWTQSPHPKPWTSHQRQRAASAVAGMPDIDVLRLQRIRGRFRAKRPGTFLAPVSRHHRIRLLHATEDLPTYLRFADWVQCCWNSSHSWYRNSAHHAMRQVLDPLSFVYHLESRRTAADPWRPCGFVMGGLAIGIDGENLAVLNGLYLKTASTELRAATLHAIETHLSSTYSLAGIGIARRHGGYGPLPQGYWRSDARVIHRLRALQEAPRPFGDDLGGTANSWSEVRNVYWKHDMHPA